MDVAPTRSKSLVAVRYLVPAAIALAGVVVLIFNNTIDGLEGFAMFVGAAAAILLLNVLHRVGVTGDAERDREEEARVFLDEHGYGPGEEPARRVGDA